MYEREAAYSSFLLNGSLTTDLPHVHLLRLSDRRRRESSTVEDSSIRSLYIEYSYHRELALLVRLCGIKCWAGDWSESHRVSQRIMIEMILCIMSPKKIVNGKGVCRKRVPASH